MPTPTCRFSLTSQIVSVLWGKDADPLDHQVMEQRLRVRDRHIAQIRRNGRMAWQAATGYNERSRIETQIGRWKSVIGPMSRPRNSEQFQPADELEMSWAMVDEYTDAGVR